MRSAVDVTISDSEVTNGTGTWLTRESAYYNQVMVLLLEVPAYNLNHIQHVLQEPVIQARQGESKYNLKQTKQSYLLWSQLLKMTGFVKVFDCALYHPNIGNFSEKKLVKSLTRDELN